MWRDLRHADIADTPHTLDARFDTESPAKLDESCPQNLPAGVAIWDAGSFKGIAFLNHAGAIGVPLLNLGALPKPLDALSRLTPGQSTPASGAGPLAAVRPPLKRRRRGVQMRSPTHPPASLIRP